MATFQGTSVSENIVGTAGDDLIIPGAGADSVFAGAGNDTISILAATDLANAGVAVNQFDGGDGIDVLSTNLQALDNLTGLNTPALTPATVWGVATPLFANIEQVEVTNASNALLTVGAAGVIAFDTAVTSAYGGGAVFTPSGATALQGTLFNGTTVAAAGGVTFDAAEGLTVGADTYVALDTITTAAGGSAVVTHDGTEFSLNYTGPAVNLLTRVNLGTTTADESITFTALQAGTGTAIDITADFGYSFANDVDLTGNSLGVRVIGTSAANTIISGSGNDTIIGGDGADTITLNNGDNTVWAGQGDTGNDSITIAGTGNNTVGVGAGNDIVNITGGGANTVYLGAGTDAATITGNGANAVWGGAGVDTIIVNGNGANEIGGGAGNDTLTITGDGDNFVYGGTGDDVITIAAAAGGNNTVYGGGLDGLTPTVGNTINLDGSGDNLIFNGQGNDTVNIANTATGDNVLYGGAGNDLFVFTGTDASATLIFEAGNGSDTITATPAQLLADADIQIDLSAFAGQFADADAVLNAMTMSGTDAVLFITAGQTITFNAVTVAELQAADPANWLIL